EELKKKELLAGTFIDIQSMVETGPFKEYLDDPSVKLEYTVEENSEYVTYLDGKIYISEDYDGSELEFSINFDLASGDMVFARLGTPLRSHHFLPNDLTYYKPLEALSYWNNLSISSSGSGIAYFIPFTDQGPQDIVDESSASMQSAKTVDVNTGENTVEMEGMTAGFYEVLIYNNGLKSSQYVRLITAESLSESEIKLTAENQMISYGVHHQDPLLDVELDFSMLGTLATSEITKSDIVVTLSLQEQFNSETAQDLILNEDDFTLENGVLKVNDLTSKFESIPHEMIDPDYVFHILINKNNKTMWNMTANNAVQAIKMTEVIKPQIMNESRTSARYIQLRVAAID
ncbi:MAG: hypothetical protein R3267_06430, partial [Paenisporosarcina sp.]|nr:hypothetical protein [Paenisporosarcina sp.]